MFEILKSHSNHTSSEVEDENSHLQTILQLFQFADNIHFFSPNLKSEKKIIVCHNAQI